MFYIQRNVLIFVDLYEYKCCSPLYVNLEEAIDAANHLDIGNEPEALRIVDESGIVCAWVSRNGYVPTGALAPEA